MNAIWKTLHPQRKNELRTEKNNWKIYREQKTGMPCWQLPITELLYERIVQPFVVNSHDKLKRMTNTCGRFEHQGVVSMGTKWRELKTMEEQRRIHREN